MALVLVNVHNVADYHMRLLLVVLQVTQQWATCSSREQRASCQTSTVALSSSAHQAAQRSIAGKGLGSCLVMLSGPARRVLLQHADAVDAMA
jgi:hypothetical protein